MERTIQTVAKPKSTLTGTGTTINNIAIGTRTTANASNSATKQNIFKFGI